MIEWTELDLSESELNNEDDIYMWLKDEEKILNIPFLDLVCMYYKQEWFEDEKE